MKVYCYNEVTGEFCWSETATPNPRELGSYLIPAHATMTPPPVLSLGEAAVFVEVDDKWKVVQDNRGTAYNKDTAEIVTIDELDYEIPDSVTKLAPDSDIINPMWDTDHWVEDLEKFRVLSDEMVTSSIVQAHTRLLPRFSNQDAIYTEKFNQATAFLLEGKEEQIVNYPLVESYKNDRDISTGTIAATNIVEARNKYISSISLVERYRMESTYLLTNITTTGEIIEARTNMISKLDSIK